MSPRPTILLVEDSEDDALLVRGVLPSLGLADGNVHVVSDGAEAVCYLKGEGRYADRRKYPFPRLLLIDLFLPRMTGFQLLEWLRDNPAYRVVPTIVFSGSVRPDDMERAYELGAHAYLVKATRPEELREMLRGAFAFWWQGG